MIILPWNVWLVERKVYFSSWRQSLLWNTVMDFQRSVLKVRENSSPLNRHRCLINLTQRLSECEYVKFSGIIGSTSRITVALKHLKRSASKGLGFDSLRMNELIKCECILLWKFRSMQCYFALIPHWIQCNVGWVWNGILFRSSTKLQKIDEMLPHCSTATFSNI